MLHRVQDSILHGALYTAALSLSHLRREVRVSLTKDRLHALDGLDDAALFVVFDKL